MIQNLMKNNNQIEKDNKQDKFFKEKLIMKIKEFNRIKMIKNEFYFNINQILFNSHKFLYFFPVKVMNYYE